MAGTLKIGSVSTASFEDAKKHFNAKDRVLDALRIKGLVLPEQREDGAPEVPDDITRLDDGALGHLLDQVGEYCSYVDGQLALADLDREQAQAALDFITARVRMAIREDEEGRKYTVSDKNDMTVTDARVLEAKDRVLFAEAFYKGVRTIRDKWQRKFDTISRRITQRGQEVERMKRGTNIAGIPTASTRFRKPGEQ